MENDACTMTFLSLDRGNSEAVYKKLKKIIEPKLCYNNVFLVISHYQEKFFTGRWKVAYGYVSSVQPVYCRHCFIIGEDGNVIDPTIFASGNQTEERKYYVTKVFEKLEEYLSAVESEDNMPALERHLRKEDARAAEIALQNNMLFI